MTATREFLFAKLAPGLPASSRAWLEASSREIAGGVPSARFSGWISLASRHVPRGSAGALEWTSAEIAQAFDLCEGWNPERWSALDTARVVLVLSRGDLAQKSAVDAIEDAFKYADAGELVALYRSLAHLPDAQRFAWRAGEGCRTSMRTVFEAAACDTPYPVRYFDDLAWRQMVIKCLFVGAPLWRVYGLDTRLDAELARMALDLADERRSAGRDVPCELWLCLGKVGGERGLAALEREFATANTLGSTGAAFSMVRAGALDRLKAHMAREKDPAVLQSMRTALTGRTPSTAFRELDPASR